MISEKQILKNISHPFIVNLFGTFHDQKSLYLVLEYIVGGEFFTHLRRAGRFDNDVRASTPVSAAVAAMKTVLE